MQIKETVCENKKQKQALGNFSCKNHCMSNSSRTIMNYFFFTSGQSPCDGSALSANSGNIQIPSDRYIKKINIRIHPCHIILLYVRYCPCNFCYLMVSCHLASTVISNAQLCHASSFTVL